jgi:hypothetical protein
MGMIATLAALVIGLLVASAKSSFDTKDAELRQFSANLILLDRQLVHYGPEASEARDLLRRYAVFKIDSTWPDEASQRVDDPDGWILLEDVQDKLRALAPRGPKQCRPAAECRRGEDAVNALRQTIACHSTM